MPVCNVPIIGIPTCTRTVNERVFHSVNEKYPNALMDATDCLPMLIPAIGSKVDVCVMLDRLDGLLLTGSPSNVHPSHYGGEASHPETMNDPERDATTLPLIREAVRRDLPILAICRGIQELNVALGGTLHQRVHELPGAVDHRYSKDTPEEKRGHEVALTAGGFFAGLAGGASRIKVNSRHGQGIDRVASRLRVEAVAPDGLIEAVVLPDARFVVGVQWHPEDLARENAFSQALFGAFAAACGATHSGIDGRARAA